MSTAPHARPSPALLEALKALDSPSALATSALESGSPYAWLVRACAQLDRSRRASARRDVEHAVALSSPRSAARLGAATLLFLTHDYQRALDLLATAAERPDAVGLAARRLSLQTANALGWDHDARAWLDACIASSPNEAGLRVERAQLAVRGGDVDTALRQTRTATALSPESPALQMELATLAAARGETVEAMAAAERALRNAPSEAETLYLRAAADAAIDAGDFARARRWLLKAVDRASPEPAAQTRLAELAAWSGDDAPAATLARAALEASPTHAAALRVLGGIAVRAGRLDEAEALLARAVALDPDDAEAWLWRGEVAFRQGRREDAEAHLHLATSRGRGHRYAAWMLRLLVVLDDETTTDTAGLVPPSRLEEMSAALLALAPQAGRRAIAERTRTATREALEAALTALRGNRSAQPTHVVDGALRRIPSGIGCRYESRAALQLLRGAGPHESVRALDEVVRRYPGSSLPLCHRGELHLWLGDLDAARRDLEASLAINIGTRWAYMGLAALALLADDPEGSLAINARGVAVMRGTEGPGIHVFRGEAYRRLGRLEEARAELSAAVRLHPSRVSATLNLALVYAELGRREEELDLFRTLVERRAPGLLADAGAELGLAVVGDGDWVPAPEDRVRLLSRALEMMRGNRSASLVTYFHRGRLRFVSALGSAHALHDRDALRLPAVRATIVAAWQREGR